MNVTKNTDDMALRNSHAIKKLLLTIIRNATNGDTKGYEVLGSPTDTYLGVMLS